MHISIVIVSWNTCELLKNCLESVLKDLQSCENEVIVVDNASTDDTVRMIREYFPDITLIENENNIGFGKANNLGIEQSTGKYILLLNPDTVIRAGAIPEMLEFIERSPRVAAVGPRLLNPDGTFQYSCSPAPTLLSEFKRLLHLPGIRPDGYYAMDEWNPGEERLVDVLLGACMLLRSEALSSVGLFDEDYFMYSEEVDLCQRLRDEGWQLYWVPAAEVVHYGGQSTNQLASQMFVNLYQSKVIYFYKHFGENQARLYQALIRLVALSRLLVAPVVWLLNPEKRSQHQSMFRNYQRLLGQSFIHPQ